MSLAEILASRIPFVQDQIFGRTAVLLPLPCYLYDTETMPASGLLRLGFFARPLGGTMAHRPKIVKTAAETNMIQPGQLSTPQKFLLIGFRVLIDEAADSPNYQALSNGVLDFVFTGNRVCLQAPLLLLMRACDKDDWERAATEIKSSQFPSKLLDSAAPLSLPEYYASIGVAEAIEKAVSHFAQADAPPLKYMSGTHVFVIPPVENFGVTLRWPAGRPTLSRDVRIEVVLSGIMLNAW